MAQRFQDVTDAELAVLQALWDLGPATIRQLTDQLYPKGGVAHYATVQKLLERLETKECVSRRRGDGVNVYAAEIDRDELIGRRLQAMAEKLCGGSLTPLLTNLVRGQRLSAQDRQALRSLIDELNSKYAPKKSRS
jgi:predicted transcriptional regulator